MCQRDRSRVAAMACDHRQSLTTRNRPRRRVRLLLKTENSDVTAMELNLGSLNSVRRFGVDFAARALPPIGAIVCNTAIQLISGITSSEDWRAIERWAHGLRRSRRLQSVGIAGNVIPLLGTLPLLVKKLRRFEQVLELQLPL
jgi:hypothetical protein